MASSASAIISRPIRKPRFGSARVVSGIGAMGGVLAGRAIALQTSTMYGTIMGRLPVSSLK